MLLAAVLSCPRLSHADPIDDYLARQMRQLRLPGLALAIVRAGKIETIRTYGKASLELDAPVTRDTVFELGSVTKQFTAAAVMRLAESGKLRVDDSVGNFLLVHFSDTKRAQDADRFLMSRGVILRSCASYGLPQCLRLTVGSEDANRAAIDALKEFATS